MPHWTLWGNEITVHEHMWSTRCRFQQVRKPVHDNQQTSSRVNLVMLCRVKLAIIRVCTAEQVVAALSPLPHSWGKVWQTSLSVQKPQSGLW